MDFVWFFLGSALVATTAVLLAASLRLRATPGFLLAAYLFGVAEMVALAEILSLFHAVTRLGYLTAGGGAALTAGAIWWARGRPRPPWPALDRFRELGSQPVLLILAGVVSIALVYEFVVGVTTPPNNWDSLWHHLVRAAMWRQYHAVETVPNAPASLGVNGDPPNAELQILFGLVMLGRDTFAATPQFLSECALLVSVFGIGRRLGFAREASAFAALLTATLSEIALQAVTTQNDLAVGALVAAAGYFMLGSSRVDVVLAGVAVGLAIGTKLTALLALPALALIALSAGGIRRVVGVMTCSVVGFAFLGAFIYIHSSTAAGTAAGNAVTVSGGGDDSVRAPPSLLTGVSGAARVLYGFIDFSGFQHVFASGTAMFILLFSVPFGVAVVARRWGPSIWLAASVPLIGYLLSRGGIALFWLFHIPQNAAQATGDARFTFGLRDFASENVSYFGPVGMLLIWPLSVWGCVAWARGKIDKRAGALAAAAPIYLAGFAATLSWNAHVGRYFISAVALVMPLAALIYRKPLFTRALTIVGVVALILVHAFNLAKPIGLAGSRPVWAMSRVDALTLERPGMRPVLERVARRVPGKAHVGLVLNSQDWSYPFFGAQLGRTVTYLKPNHVRRDAAADHIAWLIVHAPPSHWRIIKVTAESGERHAASLHTSVP